MLVTCTVFQTYLFATISSCHNLRCANAMQTHQPVVNLGRINFKTMKWMDVWFVIADSDWPKDPSILTHFFYWSTRYYFLNDVQDV